MIKDVNVNATSLRRCKDCGMLFATAQPRKRLCNDCERKHRMQSHIYQNAQRKKDVEIITEIEKAYNFEKSKDPTKSNDEKIREINRKAEAMGLSYGKYVAKYGG